MFRQILRRITRQPLFSVAVILFATVLAVILCHLNQSALAEQKSFEEAYAAVPVTFRVTDLDGSKSSNLRSWVVELFDEEKSLPPSLASFVKALHVRTDTTGEIAYKKLNDTGELTDGSKYVTLAGITSLYVAEELTPDWGGDVVWLEGYDESILQSEESVCLVPEAWKDMQQIVFFKEDFYYQGQTPVTLQSKRTLTVVGYYTDKGNTRLYCPYDLIVRILAEVKQSIYIDEICGTLLDNHSLPELREVAAKWFAEPNPSGEKTPWGRFDMEYYLYALDIDDYMLQNLSSSMKNSIRMNQLASAVVFILSAGAGFLTGFLVIRSRKRELNLMRTMGASTAAIFAEFSLEQLFCIAIGIALGGSYCLWQPIGRLALFGGIYTAGLTLALVIFLRKNLLTTIKEDE